MPLCKKEIDIKLHEKLHEACLLAGFRYLKGEDFSLYRLQIPLRKGSTFALECQFSHWFDDGSILLGAGFSNDHKMFEKITMVMVEHISFLDQFISALSIQPAGNAYIKLIKRFPDHHQNILCALHIIDEAFGKAKNPKLSVINN